MKIIIDTREKPQAIYFIKKHFECNGVEYEIKKLDAGDYMNIDNPKLLIDRKQDLREMATNCTSGHERVKREIQRVQNNGARMIFLITQDQIDGKPITCLEDVMLWAPPKGYGTVQGEKIYRVMRSWMSKYPVEYRFCSKQNAGREILKILGDENE